MSDNSKTSFHIWLVVSVLVCVAIGACTPDGSDSNDGQQVPDPVPTSPEPTGSDNSQSLPPPPEPTSPPSQPQKPNVSWNVDRYVVREERFDESKKTIYLDR